MLCDNTSSLLVQTNIALDKETRVLVIGQYIQHVADCTEGVSMDRKMIYINKWRSGVMTALRSNCSPWKRDLADRCDLLMQLYNYTDSKGRTLPILDRRHIIAALYYVCDPNDVIPDTNLSGGFADDAFAVNYCLKGLLKRHPWLAIKLLSQPLGQL